MKDNLKRSLVKFASVSVMICIAIIAFFAIRPEYARAQELRRKAADLQSRIDERKAEIERYRNYQMRFRSDPDFIEGIARQARRAYAGELVFIFPEK